MKEVELGFLTTIIMTYLFFLVLFGMAYVTDVIKGPTVCNKRLGMDYIFPIHPIGCFLGSEVK